MRGLVANPYHTYTHATTTTHPLTHPPFHPPTAITGYLDNEWIPQPCHADIGRAVGKGYVEARTDLKFDDLTSVMMHIGSVMESTDMGDAFVGPRYLYCSVWVCACVRVCVCVSVPTKV